MNIFQKSPYLSYQFKKTYQAPYDLTNQAPYDLTNQACVAILESLNISIAEEPSDGEKETYNPR